MKFFSRLSSSVGNSVAALSLTLLVTTLVGCGGGDSSSPSPSPSPSPSVAVSPSPSPSPSASPVPAPTVAIAADAPELLRGQSVRLFWNSTNAEAVLESNFEATTVAGEKVVTPLETTTYTLKVRNSVGESVTGSFEVRVAAVGVSLNPSPAVVNVSSPLTFAAQVTGAVNTGVSWSVVENGGGTINSDGVYTAPAAAGVYHIQATSNADPSKVAVAEVRVRAASGTVTVN